MKKLTLLILIVSHLAVFSQSPIKLLKSMGKDWVFIPAQNFSSSGLIGNDSVNFIPYCHKVVTSDFYIYNKEVTNKEYREFVSLTSDISMLPDTNSWNTDFTMAYNDPLRRLYFNRANYADYPVVGISQSQALAYCSYLQNKLNKELANTKDYSQYQFVVTLPTDKQWESTVYYSYLKDEKTHSQLAWILEKLIKTKDKYNLNYGVDLTKEGLGGGNYMKDGAMYPAKYDMYKPTKEGIYNLLGNVAEWTLSPAYNHTDSSKVYFDYGLKKVVSYLRCGGTEHYDTAKSYDYYYNPTYLKPIYEKDGYFAAKGGSWCHSSFYLLPEVSIYCKPTEQHSYIGFRPVLTLVKK